MLDFYFYKPVPKGSPGETVNLLSSGRCVYYIFITTVETVGYSHPEASG